MIWAHRVTSRGPWEKSQFSLMRGRVPFSKTSPGWMRCSDLVNCDLQEVKYNINKNLKGRNKFYYEAKHGAIPVNLHVGQWV